MSGSRSFRELADIVCKQAILEDLKEKLQVFMDDIDQVTKRCTSWIERTETITYLELKQYLTDKTSNYIQQFSTLAYPDLNREGMKEVSDQQPHLSADSCENKDEKNYKILEEEIINIQKRLKSLDKNYRKFSKESQETSTQLNKELHLASEFMSTLQTNIETLSQETHKSILSQDRKIEEFSDDVEKRFEQINLLVKKYNDDLPKLEQQNFKKELEQCQGHRESLKTNEKSLTEELEKSKLMLQEYIQKIRFIFKDMAPRHKNNVQNNGSRLSKYEYYESVGLSFGNNKSVPEQSNYDRCGVVSGACQQCKSVTNDCWYIPRLKDLCKGCWHKELGI